MPFPLLLLLLAGGAAAVVAASSSSSAAPAPGAASGPSPDEYQRAKAVAAAYGPQRFADPLYDCYGDPRRPYWIIAPPRGWGLNVALFRQRMNPQQGDPAVILGYEYLERSSDARSRIGAIRWKINTYQSGNPGSQAGFWLPSPGGEPSSRPGDTLLKLGESSRERLNTLADSVADKYQKLQRDAASVQKFANTYGVPTQAVTKELASIGKSLAKLDAVKTVDKALKEYGPIASAVISGVTEALASGVLSSSGAGGFSRKVAAALDAIGGVASAVPVYGTMISLATSAISGIYKQRAEEREGVCREIASNINAEFARAIGSGYVVPWHWSSVFPANSCPPEKKSLAAEGAPEDWAAAMSDDQRSAWSLGRENWHWQSGQYADLPPGTFTVNPKPDPVPVSPVYRNAIRRWWGLVNLYVGHPRVRYVYEALGRDARGGCIASDEQVMLVAAVYAVANGFDVDGFAEELWAYSSGWRAADRSFWILPEKGRKRGDGGGTTYCFGSAVPVNAWWLQWAILAQDAETIVEYWRANPSLAKPAPEPT